MPLTWNIAKIEMYKDDLDSAYIEYDSGGGEKGFDLVPITKSFIFWGGVVAIGSITKANAGMYYARSKIVEKICQISFMSEWVKNPDGDDSVVDKYITMQDVYSHIGLGTNHSTRSNPEWVKNFIGNNKSVSPEAKIIRAMLVIYEFEYDEWIKANITDKENVNA